MATNEHDIPNDLIGESIPTSPKKQTVERPDLSEPWYRPAKQYLRREQWNANILQLLNKLPEPSNEPTVLRYVGLPGQHHFDVLSMGRICTAKNIRLDYLGFRTGDGPNAKAVHLAELVALSSQTYYAPTSITYPDSIENIGLSGTLATEQFNERGPFDVVNLDVCGGILHGNTTPLLKAIKYVLTTQAERTAPWLLFVTTAAKAEHIEADIISKFFSTVAANCNMVAEFKQALTVTATKFGLSADDSLENPNALAQDNFLRFFTLAFSKWMLGNLSMNPRRSAVTLRSVYSFRNTDRPEAEMLSLAFLVSPATGGGADPSGLTAQEIPTPEKEYAVMSVGMIAAAFDELRDLDQIWHLDPEVKEIIVTDCEGLLRAIGVDEAGLQDWRDQHHL